MQFPIALDGGRGSVNLPASAFNQYNVPVLQTPGHHLRSDFARVLASKFGEARVAIVGLTSATRGSASKDEAAVVCATVSELERALSENGQAQRIDVVIWFYPRASAADHAEVAALARIANEILLVPG
ncbi:MAG: hypothetical protein ACJ8HU_08915, partial [Chthoniobacterales bacterium]